MGVMEGEMEAMVVKGGGGETRGAGKREILRPEEAGKGRDRSENVWEEDKKEKEWEEERRDAIARKLERRSSEKLA